LIRICRPNRPRTGIQLTSAFPLFLSLLFREREKNIFYKFRSMRVLTPCVIQAGAAVAQPGDESDPGPGRGRHPQPGHLPDQHQQRHRARGGRHLNKCLASTATRGASLKSELLVSSAAPSCRRRQLSELLMNVASARDDRSV
jgi:hypothetical protein